jgi:flagellar hook-associated protein 3 FlgL
MTITRVSTTSVHTQNLANITRNQDRVAQLNRQISSGKLFDSFTGLSADGNVERILSLQSQLKEADGFLNNNKVVLNRMLSANQSLGNVIKIAEDFRNNLVLRKSPGGTSIPLDAIIDNNLEQIKGELNANVAGRYIFAGSKTDRPAIGDILSDQNVSGDDPTNFYYEGDSVQFSAQVSASLSVDYGITADDPAFQKLIGAFHIAARAQANSNDRDFALANDMLNEALSDIINLQVDVNNAISTVDKANVTHEDSKLLIQDSISQVTDTDIPQATVLMSVNQTVLQASFLAFSRISQLTLLNYLN